ncbi:MAG: CAP domain-containing protein [Acidobacteriota bacterium]
MKVTRLLALAVAAAAAAAGACAAAAHQRDGGALFVLAPPLTLPLRETYPAPSHPEDTLQTAVFDRINADRSAAGLPAVAWDPDAARVAAAFCSAQIRERTRGHFLTDGLPPYARSGLAGVFGLQAENSATWLSTVETFDRSSIQLALAAHTDMMAERPPADGHRRTILDPDATHVGVGWAQELGSFRMAQEFMTRRLTRLSLRRVAENPNTVLFEGKTLDSDRLEFVTLSLEPEPHRLTKADANSRTSYTYPAPRIGYVREGQKFLRVEGAVTEDRIRIGDAGEFSFRFTPPQPGLWTLLFYTARGREEPRPGGLAVLWVEQGGAR